MSDKSLEKKAINIRGKKYVLVSDRVIYFNENYPNGSITTELISDPTSEMVIVKATVVPDTKNPTRTFSDYSQAVIGEGMVNKTAALENASTSAVGRALGYMGIGVIEAIASADEMNKATTNNTKFATFKQIEWLRDTAHQVNDQLGDNDETDDWIESILTIRPDKVPVYKVKDAVDKLKEEPPAKELQLDIDVTDEDIQALKDGKLDY